MDIIYPLGNGSKWYNYEVLFSIRSLVKHFKGNLNIYIVGEKPTWFDYKKINHIPFVEKRVKDQNIFDKMFFVSNLDYISEDFLFINDDHFLLSDFTEFPHYHNGTIESKGWHNQTHRNPYFNIVRRTLHLLEQMGNPTKFFDIHCPMMINKEKFREMYKYLLRYITTSEGLIMKSAYCNFHGIEGEYMEDLKFKSRFDYGYMSRSIKGRYVFSIGDSACSGALKKLLDELYPPEFGIFEK